MNIKTEDQYKWFWEKLDVYLGDKRLKQTSQRRVIGDCMLNMKKHFGAEELHQMLRSQGHDIGLATVYRTLNLFKDAGLVNQKVFADNSAFFEVEDPDTHHDHLFCLDCNRVIEFENEEIEQLQEQVALKYGFSLRSHRLDMWGRCQTKNCAYKTRK